MSAKTAGLAATPAPTGKPGGPGLFHQKGNKLPNYIEQIAQALRRNGKTESEAVSIAIATCKRWAAGGGKVKPEVQAAAAAAIAEWEKLKASSHAHANEGDRVDLANTPLGQQAKNIRVKVALLKQQAANTTDKAAKARLLLQAKKLSAQAGVLSAQQSQASGVASSQKKAANAAKSTLKKKAASAKKGAAAAAKASLTASQNKEQARLAVQRKGINATEKKQENATAALKAQQDGKPTLPPGATHWKHNWVPVDSNGNPVGPSQAGKAGAAQPTSAQKKKPAAAGAKGGKSGGITLANEGYTSVVSSADGARAVLKLSSEISSAHAKNKKAGKARRLLRKLKVMK